MKMLESKKKTIRVSVADPTDSQCFMKAVKRGQKTFTLVEQDITAVKTIAHWIYLNIKTAPGAKLRQALEDALIMREFVNQKAAD